MTAEARATTVDEAAPTFEPRSVRGPVIEAKKAPVAGKPLAPPTSWWDAWIGEVLRPVLGWLTRLWQRGGQKLVADGNLARKPADMPTLSSRSGLDAQSSEVTHLRSPGPPLEVASSATRVLEESDASAHGQAPADTAVTTPPRLRPDKPPLPLPLPREPTPKSGESRNSASLPIREGLPLEGLAQVGRLRETETPPPGPPMAATSAPAVPQTEDVGPTPLRGDASAPRSPPTDRTSFTTGAEPGRGRQQSHLKEIGRYHIIQPPLSEGRVGPLYQAWDKVAHRLVALKVISNDPHVAADEQERFFRAGKLWTRLDHPNIVRIYDYNSQPDARFIVTELLEGMDLGHYIDSRKSLSLADKLSIIMQVCNGLNHIHGHGFIHRDIRPTNKYISVQPVAREDPRFAYHSGGGPS